MIGPVWPSAGALSPLGLDQVRLAGGFWGDRQQLVAAATLPHCRSWVERSGWLDNLRAAGAGTLTAAARTGRSFADSEVYKLAEATAWESTRRGGDPELDAALDELGAVLAAAQEPDGYLHTGFGRPGQPPRWSDPEWGHELYCLGHLIQAAVARLRGHREDRLVRVAVRAADHLCDRFARVPGVDGHPEVELALVELYRATGQRRYLAQARRFVDRRGRRVGAVRRSQRRRGDYSTLADIELGRGYFQDDVPVREAVGFSGHAVRALYLACGAVDVAVETGDDALLAAVVRQWERTVAARTYLTGGIGSRSEGEAIGDDFELPSDGAYAETCAAIASVMLSWRLALATGEPRFGDLAERTLYNAVAVGLAADGLAFFYRNPLQQRTPGNRPAPEAASPRAAAGLRAPWFEVACCPTNLARTLASLGGYLATVDDAGLQLHQYAPGTVRAPLAGGRPVAVTVDTGYPWSGAVTVRVDEPGSGQWTLSLRIPPWAAGATVTVGDEPARPAPPGWLRLTRGWRPGDRVRLALPVAPRWTFPDPRIDALRGQVAVERGPLVYCAESVGGTEPPLDRIEVVPTAPPAELPAGDLAPGAVALTVPAFRLNDPGPGWPYRPVPPPDPAPGGGTDRLHLIPYHRWANRGPATMRVWLPHADRTEQPHEC